MYLYIQGRQKGRDLSYLHIASILYNFVETRGSTLPAMKTGQLNLYIYIDLIS